MSTFDHADVIGSIPDGQCDSTLVFFDQLNHLSFLQRSDPATDHCLAHACRPQQLHLQVLLQTVRLREDTTWTSTAELLHTTDSQRGLDTPTHSCEIMY